jgi:hypothetical protein
MQTLRMSEQKIFCVMYLCDSSINSSLRLSASAGELLQSILLRQIARLLRHLRYGCGRISTLYPVNTLMNTLSPL